MSKFQEIYSQLRRIAILRFLMVVEGRTVNTDVLKIVLNERGITTSKEDLDADIHFLWENDCIKKEFFGEEINLEVIYLTEKGEDVATGKTIIKGIRRPRYGDNLPKLPDDELGVPYGSR